MRTLFVAAVLAAGVGIAGTVKVSALPISAAAVGDTASANSLLSPVYYHYRYRDYAHPHHYYYRYYSHGRYWYHR